MQPLLREPTTTAELRAHYALVRRRLGLDVMRFQAPAPPRRLSAALTEEQIERAEISDIATRYQARVKADPNVAKVALVITLAAEAFGFSEEEILGHCRVAELAHVRHIAVALAHHLTGKKASEVGRLCSGRCHTSVNYSRRVTKELLDAALGPEPEMAHG